MTSRRIDQEGDGCVEARVHRLNQPRRIQRRERFYQLDLSRQGQKVWQHVRIKRKWKPLIPARRYCKDDV